MLLYICRKQDLRELKLLQKNENKQYQDLIYKAQIAREMQDRKFETDMQVCLLAKVHFIPVYKPIIMFF